MPDCKTVRVKLCQDGNGGASDQIPETARLSALSVTLA